MTPNLFRKTKWLRFMIVEKKPKTVVIRVYNKDQHLPGQIRWHGPWRQYIWDASDVDAIFNNGCLQDIADVLSSLNKEQRSRRC